MAFNIVTTKRVPCFGQYDRIDDFTTGELRGDKRPAFRQFLVDEFHVSAVCKCFDPLFVWHFRILSVLRFSRSIEERPVRNLRTLSEIPHNGQVRLVHERLEDSLMTAPKSLSRTKTHVRCGIPDCDWGNADARFQRMRIGPLPSRIPRASHRAPWPGS